MTYIYFFKKNPLCNADMQPASRTIFTLAFKILNYVLPFGKYLLLPVPKSIHPTPAIITLSLVPSCGTFSTTSQSSNQVVNAGLRNVPLAYVPAPR